MSRLISVRIVSVLATVLGKLPFSKLDNDMIWKTIQGWTKLFIAYRIQYLECSILFQVPSWQDSLPFLHAKVWMHPSPASPRMLSRRHVTIQSRHRRHGGSIPQQPNVQSFVLTSIKETLLHYWAHPPLFCGGGGGGGDCLLSVQCW